MQEVATAGKGQAGKGAGSRVVGLSCCMETPIGQLLQDTWTGL